jgi:uncharacterized protein YecT (DUF1311 family)
MLGLTLLFVLMMLLAPTCAEAAAAEPSFNCRTAKNARELATCGDPKLAAADRELAAAWHEAIARLDPPTAKALREDQRKFLSDIDAGFDAELWGKQDPPEGKELRAQIAQLRRGGDYDALAALEAELRERTAFLRHLTPAASIVGLWKNHNSELLVTAADDGRYGATYGTTNFGWAKYHCHFTAAFAAASGAADKRLAAHAPHNADARCSWPVMARCSRSRRRPRTMSATRSFRASAHAAASSTSRSFTPVCAPRTRAASSRMNEAP